MLLEGVYVLGRKHTYTVHPKEATTVLSNVDKDGNQILHEDEEQKVENLPTKRTRRLPTTRHMDFLWLDTNMKQQQSEIQKPVAQCLTRTLRA